MPIGRFIMPSTISAIVSRRHVQAFESGVECNMADVNEGKNLTENSPSLRNLTSPEYSKLKNEQCKVSTSSNTYLHEFFFLFKHV